MEGLHGKTRGASRLASLLAACFTAVALLALPTFQAGGADTDSVTIPFLVGGGDGRLEWSNLLLAPETSPGSARLFRQPWNEAKTFNPTQSFSFWDYVPDSLDHLQDAIDYFGLDTSVALGATMRLHSDGFVEVSVAPGTVDQVIGSLYYPVAGSMAIERLDGNSFSISLGRKPTSGQSLEVGPSGMNAGPSVTVNAEASFDAAIDIDYILGEYSEDVPLPSVAGTATATTPVDKEETLDLTKLNPALVGWEAYIRPATLPTAVYLADDSGTIDNTCETDQYLGLEIDVDEFLLARLQAGLKSAGSAQAKKAASWVPDSLTYEKDLGVANLALVLADLDVFPGLRATRRLIVTPTLSLNYSFSSSVTIGSSTAAVTSASADIGTPLTVNLLPGSSAVTVTPTLTVVLNVTCTVGILADVRATMEVLRAELTVDGVEIWPEMTVSFPYWYPCPELECPWCWCEGDVDAFTLPGFSVPRSTFSEGPVWSTSLNLVSFNLGEKTTKTQVSQSNDLPTLQLVPLERQFAEATVSVPTRGVASGNVTYVDATDTIQIDVTATADLASLEVVLSAGGRTESRSLGALASGAKASTTVAASLLSSGPLTIEIKRSANGMTDVLKAAGGTTVFVDLAAPTAPAGVRPSSGSLTNVSNPTLMWDPSADNAGGSGIAAYVVKGTVYRWSVNTGWVEEKGRGFEAEVAAPAYTLAELPPGLMYKVEWQVTAKDQAGHVGAPSPASVLTVDRADPTKVVPIMPTDRATISKPVGLRLFWEPASDTSSAISPSYGVVSYQVDVIPFTHDYSRGFEERQGATESFIVKGALNTSLTLPDSVVPSVGEIRWWVHAIDAAGNFAAADERHIEISASPSEKTTVFVLILRPELVEPQNGRRLNSDSVTLGWKTDFPDLVAIKMFGFNGDACGVYAWLTGVTWPPTQNDYKYVVEVEGAYAKVFDVGTDTRLQLPSDIIPRDGTAVRWRVVPVPLNKRNGQPHCESCSASSMWSFICDRVKPEVIAVAASGVKQPGGAYFSDVAIQFSEPMQGTAVPIALYPNGGGAAGIAPSRAWWTAADKYMARFDCAIPAGCAVHVLKGLDIAGNTMTEYYDALPALDAIAPPAPGGLSPANGAWVTTLDPVLTWDTPDDGGGSGVVRYHVDITVKRGDKSHTLAVEEGLTNPAYELDLTNILTIPEITCEGFLRGCSTNAQPPYEITWSVRAADLADNWGPSATGSFRVDARNPEAPVLLSPGAMVRLSEAADTRLEWSPANDNVGVDHYEVTLDSTAGTRATFRCAGTVFIIPAGALTAGNTFTWRVCAVDVAGNAGPKSEPRKIESGISPEGDWISNVAPADGLVTATRDGIKLTWSGKDTIRLVIGDWGVHVSVPGTGLYNIFPMSAIVATWVSSTWVSSSGHYDFALALPPGALPLCSSVVEWKVQRSWPDGSSKFSEVRTLKYVSPIKIGQPGAPTARVEDSRVVIQWASATCSPSSCHYTVFRKVKGEEAFVALGWNIAGAEYSDSTAVPGVEYEYRVQACDATCCGELSAAVYAGRTAKAPSSVSATDGSDAASVTVSWSDVPEAVAYKVWRAPTDAFESAEAITITEVADRAGAAAFDVKDTTAAPGALYWYAVSALFGAGTESALSKPDSGFCALGQVEDLKASDGLTGAVDVTWTALAEAGFFYVVQRAESENGAYTTISPASGMPSPGFSDSPPRLGQQYWYRVRACTSVACGPYSKADSGSCSAVPAAPTGISATDGTRCDCVYVTWNAVEGATLYELFRATSAEGLYNTLGTIGLTHWVNNSAVPGTPYYYKVKALSDTGASDFSDTDSGFRPGTPVAPTGISATDGTHSDKVRITWNAVSGATTYDIHRATSLDGTYSELATGLGPATYDDATAAVGATYYYKVLAKSTCGASGLSTADAGSKACPIAGAPTGVKATDGSYCDKVRISWSAVTGATSYAVHRSTSSGGTYSSIGTPSGTAFDDTTATAGTTYYYKVLATNACGPSALSGNDSGLRNAIPGVPSGVSATDGAYCDKVTVSWSAVTGAASYAVHRSTTSGGTYSSIGTPSRTTFDDTTASAGTTYYYKVLATNTCGSSALSSYDSGSRKAVLGAPSGVSATDGTVCAAVMVTWNAVEGATTYEFYRATSEGGTYELLGTRSQPNWTNNSAVPGTTYYYKVKAVNACGASGFSGSDSGFRPVPPAAPTGIDATDGTHCDSVHVTWNAVEGATKYKAFRAESPGGPWGTLGETSNLLWVNGNVVPGTTYYYKVIALDGVCQSADSDVDSGYRQSCP